MEAECSQTESWMLDNYGSRLHTNTKLNMDLEIVFCIFFLERSRDSATADLRNSCSTSFPTRIEGWCHCCPKGFHPHRLPFQICLPHGQREQADL